MEEARKSCADLIALHIPVYSSARIAEHALSFATEEHHSVYDALYVVLAFERGCEFITADRPLVNKLGGKYLFIRWLDALELPADT